MGIIWLASYPKSGNTWIRVFLANYLSEADGPVDINGIAAAPIASSREAFDDFVGLEAADLTPTEIASCRPDAYRMWSAASSSPQFVKVHDAQTRNVDGQLLFPTDASAGIIYVIRNPLDVAVSFAHHSGIDLDTAVARMCQDEYEMSPSRGRLGEQLSQRLLSWSRHAESWLDASEIPVHTVRYEDLLIEPARQFGAIIRFAGLEMDEARLAAAVEHSRFDLLRAQEEERGFKERFVRASAPFFREGRSGGWRQVLSQAQVRTLVDAHGAVMRRFGYLTTSGEPVESLDNSRGEFSGSG